jgi:tRNA (mo5U34)-methyltransferase
MAAQHPFMVLGIEPYLTFYFQYLALQRYIRASNIYCLPFKLEELPQFSRYFDTIFCMGILYHRKSPLESLAQMAANMKPGGQLVLETLIIPGEETMALVPEKRYAKMNNVFFLPTLNCLHTWLRRSGFKDIHCIDVSPTTPREQRRTDWIQTESLADFLDPNDPTRTIEGYPAPVRAILLARSA